MQLPDKYKWLSDEPAPKILLEALKTYGVKETPGLRSNPVILNWAKTVGLDRIYTTDSIPWCALGMTYWAKQARYLPPQESLAAASWVHFGNGVAKFEEMLGDVLVFTRKGGNHVALYVGEDEDFFHILGANQNDAVGIERKSKAQLIAARRCQWQFGQPPNVRKIHLQASGEISAKES